MKKVLYILLLVVATFALVGYGLFYVLRNNTLKGLKAKDDEIDLLWEGIYRQSTRRSDLLYQIAAVKNVGCDSDSLRFYLLENKSKRSPKEIKSLWLLEYYTNQQYIKVGPCYAVHPDLKGLLQGLIANAEDLNERLAAYNAAVREFNVYYSTFPNFLFAKDGGFTRKAYFELQYGRDNSALYREKKDLQQWIETGK